MTPQVQDVKGREIRDKPEDKPAIVYPAALLVENNYVLIDGERELVIESSGRIIKTLVRGNGEIRDKWYGLEDAVESEVELQLRAGGVHKEGTKKFQEYDVILRKAEGAQTVTAT